MTTTLGIAHACHDTGAAIVRDGEIVGAVNESRLSRVKRESRFPASSVNYLLRELDDGVDEIAVSGVASPYLGRNVRQLASMYFRRRASTDWTARSLWRGLREPDRILRETADALSSETVLRADPATLADRMTYVGHHRAHAASAYYTSGFDEATVVTIDAAGDGFSSTVFSGRDGELTREHANDDIDSLGKVWAQMPTVFGFKGAMHAGKFMGMAAYVDEVPSDLRSELRDLLRIDGLDVVNTHERQTVHDGYEAKVRSLQERFGDYGAPAVARALQERTEEVAAEFVRNAVAQTGLENVAVAGGVAANVKVNQRIYELPAVDRIFVHPNMGDGGIGLGAALEAYARDHGLAPSRMEDVFLGPEYGPDAIEHAVDRIGTPDGYAVERYDDEDAVADAVASVLADGGVVNLYQGQVEYGPRALGNRSILYQPTDPSAIEWLNERLDRTEFMPFAPVTLREHAEECYENYDPDRCPAADFMTITFDCTETMTDRSPGVVHVDGTARPQIVDEATNSTYAKILEAYRQRTGIPTLINTSFNMHGEPIVCKPAEALRAFLRTGNEALVMERMLVRRDA